MSQAATESILLESVVPDLKADGYEVFPRPRAPLLPAFMRGYRPDAIAYRSGRKLAIKVLREGVPSKLRDLLSEHKDWELQRLLGEFLRCCRADRSRLAPVYRTNR